MNKFSIIITSIFVLITLIPTPFYKYKSHTEPFQKVNNVKIDNLTKMNLDKISFYTGRSLPITRLYSDQIILINADSIFSVTFLNTGISSTLNYTGRYKINYITLTIDTNNKVQLKENRVKGMLKTHSDIIHSIKLLLFIFISFYYVKLFFLIKFYNPISKTKFIIKTASAYILQFVLSLLAIGGFFILTHRMGSYFNIVIIIIIFILFIHIEYLLYRKLVIDMVKTKNKLYPATIISSLALNCVLVFGLIFYVDFLQLIPKFFHF